MADGEADQTDASDERTSAEEAYKTYCKAESDEAYQTINKNQEEYDKQLLTLSTGILAVLIAFLKDLVHLDSAVCKSLLYLGFIGFGFTVLCVIVSFQASIYALERVRIYFEAHYNGKTEVKFPLAPSKVVKGVNWVAGLAFVAGVVSTFLFITINLSHQSTGGPHENSWQSTRGDADKRSYSERFGTEGLAYEGSRQTCPSDKTCKFTIVEEIGDSVANKQSKQTTDGSLIKTPQQNKSGGTYPKIPINKGSTQPPPPRK